MREVKEMPLPTQFGQRVPKGEQIAQIAQDQVRARYGVGGIDPFNSSYLRK